MNDVDTMLAELDSIYETVGVSETQDNPPALRGLTESTVILDDIWEEDEEYSDEEAKADVETLLSEVVEDFDRLMKAVEVLSGKIDKIRAILTESVETDVEGN